MTNNNNRLKKLEGAAGGEGVHAFSVVWGDEETDTVTIWDPLSRRGETMLLKDLEEQFPDARHTAIRVVWKENDEIVSLSGDE